MYATEGEFELDFNDPTGHGDFVGLDPSDMEDEG